MSLERPWHVAVLAGAATHHGFELACGVGLMFQRQLGLPAATLLWSALFPGAIGAARLGSARWDDVLAGIVGANLAAVCVHYTLWPWRLLGGLPVLLRAEELDRRYLPAYNAVLLAWGTAGAVAAVRKVPSRARLHLALGFVAALPLRADAQQHVAWMHERARAQPAWWNRAMQ